MRGHYIQHVPFEGIIIGAFAIGSHKGYVCVRNEYPLDVRILEMAINQNLYSYFIYHLPITYVW
ncbi:hypothetical protein CW696_08500 [ANME-2 cluster archaeon]|nr:MAG: hypothetical protein CW696_08500 [ANME-2 cluster archaeon]RLG23366.1 MAG: hypothetical protein DRN77_04670 [Methanosarcinales archaeon]